MTDCSLDDLISAANVAKTETPYDSEVLKAAAHNLLVNLQNLLAVYSEPDRQLCCDGRDCGCMGATIYDEAEYYARHAIAKATGAA